MSRSAAPLLLGHTARSRRGGPVAAVALALLTGMAGFILGVELRILRGELGV